MDRKRLRDLVCVTRVGNHICKGRLRLKEAITCFESPSDEIKEGVLKCSQCKAEYPVLSGVPILMGEIRKFLREKYYYLTGVCRTNGGLSREMHSYLMSQIILELKSSNEELFPKQKAFNRSSASDFLRGISSYFINHYGNLLDFVEKSDPLYGFLRQHAHNNPQSILRQMALKHSNGRNGTAVEIGCSVGGLSAKLSGFFKFVYGIDESLQALVLARRIVKQIPEAFKRYPVCREKNRYYRRNINIPGR